MKYTRDFLIGTTSSIAGGFILAGMGLVSTSVVHGLYADDTLFRALLCILFVGLVSGATVIFFAKRKSQFDRDSKIPRFRRWLRVAASVAVFIGIVPLVWAFLPDSFPNLKLNVRNQSKYGIVIPDQEEFFITVSQTPSSKGIATTGRCNLSWFPPPQQRDKPLVVISGETAQFECQILNPKTFRRYLELQSMDVEMYLDSSVGVARGTVAFNRHALQEHWMEFDFN